MRSHGMYKQGTKRADAKSKNVAGKYITTRQFLYFNTRTCEDTSADHDHGQIG